MRSGACESILICVVFGEIRMDVVRSKNDFQVGQQPASLWFMVPWLARTQPEHNHQDGPLKMMRLRIYTLMQPLPDSKAAAALEHWSFGPRLVYIEATRTRKGLQRLQNFEPIWMKKDQPTNVSWPLVTHEYPLHHQA
jgi:hypothetical protein